MALNPKTQLKRLAIGTSGAIISMFLLILTSVWELSWLFYLFTFLLACCVLYAIPGYIGVWVWRMRGAILAPKNKKVD